ncbi:MAG: beta strand repeat-containing protein, partial [Candidatus Kariarchaeaceae archaeon]
NGTSIFSTSWTSGDIEILVDGLSAGVYNYTIVVADKSSNQASDTVFVTVIDNILPSLNTPSDIIYAEESTGNAIDWTGIDLHADNYIIYENGSEVDTGSWASGAPISFDIDGLLKGAYNFTIIIFDTSNNSANDTVIVTVNDETSPSVNNPANILYAFGLTGNLINWTATDNYNNSYIIYQNGSLVDNGNWDSGVTISYNVDGFGNGNYNFTILFTDLSGNSVTDTVILTVVDGTNLSVSSLADTQYLEGTTGNTLDWTGVDDQPNNYTIFQNGSQVDTSSWLSGVPISYNMDGLSQGVYNFTIIIYDDSMNSVSDIVIVTVIDSTNPTFSTSPSNLQYAEGQTSNILTWNSTDLYPNTYIIYKDGSSIDTGSWTNASTITLNVDGLSKAVYNYTIVVVDVFNNQGVDTVFVTVIDQTDPVFADTPNDITYTEGSVGNIVNWTATDSYSGNYIILQDGFQVDINTWTSGVAINYPIDGLAKGVYNFTIVISDNSDNSIVDTVLVTVIDLTPPSLSSPANIQYEDGSTGNKITWNSVDNYPETMTVYRNGSVKFTGSWTSGDIEYIIVDTVIVTVVDTIDPTINSPTDVSYSEGATGQSISWTGTDNHPNNYVILLNGSLDSSSVWGSGIPIVYSVDGYAKGTYNVTITVFDTSNNSKSDTVIVIVNDTTNPSVNSPTDAQYSEGSTGNTIDWTSTENYPETYIIYQNGSQIDTNSWTSGIPINHDINGLPKGGYNFTIIIFDASNNYVVDTVFITVVDTTNPIFVESPTDLQYGEGITGNSLIWNSTDTYPGNYIIYLDDISVDTGAW